jgi:hypothetical protein
MPLDIKGNVRGYSNYTVCFTNLDQESEILNRFGLHKSMKHTVHDILGGEEGGQHSVAQTLSTF